jgi:hypothetical protein
MSPPGSWEVRACEAGWRANLSGAFALAAVLGWSPLLCGLLLMVILMAVTLAVTVWRAHP